MDDTLRLSKCQRHSDKHKASSRDCCFAIQFSRNKRCCFGLSAKTALLSYHGVHLASTVSCCQSLLDFRFGLIGFFGGAKEDRTPDLLLARQALSQLSYGPMGNLHTHNHGDGPPDYHTLRRTSSLSGANMVGLSGLEPPTSPLSGVRSNQLS